MCGQSVTSHVLGDECNSDWECRENITGSICHRGRCACQPFYARINQTSCLQGIFTYLFLLLFTRLYLTLLPKMCCHQLTPNFTCNTYSIH